ncbi:CRISPR-associated protein Csx16 [Pelistega sp. MC2]|uniref:CRISPR-associated protein Csx16 n=1 Tax=Pelistega sp. MC2 TaxID=1720297 RepID=UPI0008DA3580|nr:CRISPR-associated protein Csx16 [Pelistega sp. MC2]
MTCYFISRHQGAASWIQEQGLEIDQMLTHLDMNILKRGDTVVGTLPINLVAELTELGVRYLHLTLNMPESMRGKELSPEEMKQINAYLQEYQATKVE